MVNEQTSEPAQRQAFFNRQPAVVLLLGGAIVAAHAWRTFASPEIGEAIAERYAVVPLNYEEGISAMNALPLVAHAFVHAGWLHLIFNMVLYLAVSGTVVQRLGEGMSGALRFLALFFACAIVSALTFVAFNRGSPVGAVGASGAICGLFSAYLMGARWDWRASLRDKRVLSAGAWFLALNVGLAAAVRQAGVMPIAWEAHLGGFIAGVLLFPFLAPKVAQLRGPWA
jgi:membrane associated rhomboid family serine protease